MNIYAQVRCRCYDDGVLRPGPVPFSDLYLDEECIELIDSLNQWHRYDGLLTHVSIAGFVQLTPEACQSLIGELKSLIAQVETERADRGQQGRYLFGERLLKLMQASAKVRNPLQLLY